VSVCGAVARCVESGKGQFPVRFVISADALEGFERFPAPAVVVALHPRQPSAKLSTASAFATLA
jgi:hypothetical protein